MTRERDIDGTSADRSGASRTASYSMLLFTVCLGALLSHLSVGIVNVALPDMAVQLDSPVSSVQWVISAYLLAVTASLPIMGKLADRFNKRLVHNNGYWVFGAGALLSALAPSLPLLVSSRVLQGVGAAMFQATNLAIISAVYPEERRGRALGFVSTAVAVGAMLGPAMGGLIIEWLPWHALFWVQVPIAAAIFLMAQRFVPLMQPGQTKRLDLVGALFFVSASTGLVAGLSMGSEQGWDSWLTLTAFVVALLGIGWFSFWTKRTEDPFIDVAMFGDPMVRVGISISLVSFTAAFAALATLPFYLRGMLDASPAITGLTLMAYPLLLSLLGPVGGALSDRFGSFAIILGGLIVMVSSLLGLSSLSGSWSVYHAGAWLALLGASMGTITAPNYNLLMSQVPKTSLATMTSLIALARNLGMVLGTAVGLSLIANWIPGNLEIWMSNEPSATGDGAGSVLLGFRAAFWFPAALAVAAGYYLWRNNK